MKAIWKDKVIAESDDTVVVEGNHYFPASSLRREYSGCPAIGVRARFRGCCTRSGHHSAEIEI